MTGGEPKLSKSDSVPGNIGGMSGKLIVGVSGHELTTKNDETLPGYTWNDEYVASTLVAAL